MTVQPGQGGQVVLLALTNNKYSQQLFLKISLSQTLLSNELMTSISDPRPVSQSQ